MECNAVELGGQSHVVDASGNLLHVYHGSKALFERFDLSHCTDCLEFGGGFYFAVNREDVCSYTKGGDGHGYVYETTVRLQNPYKTGVGLRHKSEFCEMDALQIREKLIGQGYDGVLHVWWDGTLYDKSVVVAFYPEQIDILAVHSV